MTIFPSSSVESCGGGHGYLLERREVCPSSPKNDRSMTMAILLPSSVESCGSGLCHHLLEEEVCSILERIALKTADKDVLVRGQRHGLIIMANLAMVGGLPFYS